MEAASDQIRQMLDLAAARFAGDVSQKMLAAVAAADLSATDRLKQSIHNDAIQATADLKAQVLTEFADYGRIQDMRNPLWKKLPPIEQIEAWVKARGLGAFEYVPGYARGTFPLSQARAINRIAWGIARSRQTGLARQRTRAWFNKTFYKSLNPLLDDLARRYTDICGRQLQIDVNV